MHIDPRRRTVPSCRLVRQVDAEAIEVRPGAGLGGTGTATPRSSVTLTSLVKSIGSDDSRSTHAVSSVDTSKLAIYGRVKTGHNGVATETGE
jgi:hypothetical protein